MTTVTVRTLSGVDKDLPRAALDELGWSLRGRLILPGDADYDQARAVWNGLIDRRPAALARCLDDADVRACVRFANAHDLLVAVRGGGHNVAGFATCDGGLVIDLSAMRAVTVDAEARSVRAQAGVTWGALDRATQVFGLAVPGGVVSTTGVAGLTLGGGQGWLRRTYGMSCDSLIAAHLVTAEGRSLTANDTTNVDLFWALRGGGGNFGIVTEFEFRLHPVGPLVAFVCPVYAIESAQMVLGGFRGFAAAAPDTVNVNAVLWHVPADPAFPAQGHARSVVSVAGLFVGEPERGEEVLAPLRTLGEPLFDLSSRLSYVDLQQMFDPFFPKGRLRYYWKASHLDALDDAAVTAVDEAFQRRPSPLSMVSIWALGGAMGRVGARETAAGQRDAAFMVEIMANWRASDDTEAQVAWVRDTSAAMGRVALTRPSFNFPGGGDDSDAFVHAVFGTQYERLLEVKRRYDPANRFRLNQNVS